MNYKKIEKTLTVSIKKVNNETKDIKEVKNMEIVKKDSLPNLKKYPNPFYQPEMNTAEFSDVQENTNIIVTIDSKDSDIITKKDWLFVFKKLWKNKVITFKQFWSKRKEIKKINKNP